ncbi:MAG: TrkH family potassium uptake protein [Clostridiales bacterium]|nr:TrkH family potassium uptake protein [Clostridiales bacterium]
MNRRMVFYTVGQILLLEAVLLVLPLAVSLVYAESCFTSFIITILITAASGFLLKLIFKPKDHVIFAKEGFLIVALAWLMMSLFGALPFVLSREIPSFINAFFETVSGLTTTGASIIPDLSVMSKGILFWRSFTHWIGGMGIIVLIMAIIPTTSGRSIHVMRAEMPGPIVGKLVPRIRDTAKILYLIYIVMTAVEIVLLKLGDMSLFDSVVHSFGTAGTGGFGIRGDSLGSYSAYSQWVITIFMLIFGVNFNLYYLLLVRRARTVFRSEELRAYAAVVVAAVVMIAINIRGIYETFGETIRHAAFQVSSVITTTGYATVNFDLWPGFSKAMLFILMFIGGCAGSTAGGLKISRVFLLVRMVRNNIRKILHPRAVASVSFEGKILDERTQKSVSNYLSIYVLSLFAVFLIISLDPFDLETNLTAAVSCFNNVGPGLAGVGPAMNYNGYSVLSKIVLSFSMLLGRLEIYPLIIAFIPASWLKKNNI